MNATPSKRQDGWREMLAEFRALGGTAENVCCREGERGRGLFAEDASRPVRLRAPENLLLPREEVVFQDGKFRVASTSNMASAEKAWLEHYENEFSWGGGGRSEVEAFFEGIDALPNHLREKLAKLLAMPDLIGDTTSESVQQRFLDSRVIEYNNRSVVMPIIELINHGRAPGYDRTAGVAVNGTFTDEVLVRYSGMDAFGFFRGWGICSDEGIALSIPLRQHSNENDSLGDLCIDRKIDDDNMTQDKATGIRLPKLTVKENTVELSFLVLGDKRFPRLSRAIFQRIFRDAGLRVSDERFEMLRRTNNMFFLGVLGELEAVNAPMATTLRTMCRFQLEALASCFGTRQI